MKKIFLYILIGIVFIPQFSHADTIVSEYDCSTTSCIAVSYTSFLQNQDLSFDVFKGVDRLMIYGNAAINGKTFTLRARNSAGAVIATITGQTASNNVIQLINASTLIDLSKLSFFTITNETSGDIYRVKNWDARQLTQDTGNISFGLAIIIFLISMMFWAIVYKTTKYE